MDKIRNHKLLTTLVVIVAVMALVSAYNVTAGLISHFQFSTESRLTLKFDNGVAVVGPSNYKFTEKETVVWAPTDTNWQMQSSNQSTAIDCSKVQVTNTGVQLLAYCLTSGGTAYVYAALDGHSVQSSCLPDGMLFNSSTGSILVTNNKKGYNDSANCKLLK